MKICSFRHGSSPLNFVNVSSLVVGGGQKEGEYACGRVNNPSCTRTYTRTHTDTHTHTIPDTGSCQRRASGLSFGPENSAATQKSLPRSNCLCHKEFINCDDNPCEARGGHGGSAPRGINQHSRHPAPFVSVPITSDHVWFHQG